MRILAISLLLTGLARAGSPDFVAHAASGKEERGPIVRLDRWTLQLGKGDGQRLPAGQWLSLRRADLTLPEFPTEDHLVLANGDRVPAAELRLDDEKLYFRHKALADGKITSLPLSAAALIWRLPPDGVVSAEGLRHRLLRAKRSKDVVLLRNGDTVEGTLQAIKGGSVEVEANKKVTSVRWGQVSAIALSTELLDRLRPKGAHARVILTGAGGRLTVTSASCDGTTFEGRTAFGAELSVPLDQVAGLEMFGDNVVSLSDLTPAKYEYSPFLDERWAWSADSTVTGGNLRLGGSTYDRGVGLHAGSRATYALGGKYRAFEALVGLDDRDGKRGRVKLRVLVDGKPAELGKGDVLTHADGALAVRVEVDGAKELTLEVSSAERGPVQGVVNWVNARLLR